MRADKFLHALPSLTTLHFCHTRFLPSVRLFRLRSLPAPARPIGARERMTAGPVVRHLLGDTQLNCLSDRNEAVIATLKCAVRHRPRCRSKKSLVAIPAAGPPGNAGRVNPEERAPRILPSGGPEKHARLNRASYSAATVAVAATAALKYELINRVRSRAR